MFGVAETERLPRAAYAPEDDAKRVYAALADKARRVIAAGHSAIVDAVFARADERAQIAAVGAHEQRAVSTACFSPPISTIAHRARRRRVRTTPPTPTPTVARAAGKLRRSARWTGPRSTPPAIVGQTLRAAQDALASHASGSPILR